MGVSSSVPERSLSPKGLGAQISTIDGPLGKAAESLGLRATP